MLDLWRGWITNFDNAVVTDDWEFAEEFLAEDVVYVVAGAPFGCELRGRENVVAGFKRSLTNFDRKFDERRWEAVNINLWNHQAITCLAKGDYLMEGKPPITFAAHGQWFFRDQKICLMTDLYDLNEVNTIETLGWLDKYGDDLDPNYL